jgi:hypothetical protein
MKNGMNLKKENYSKNKLGGVTYFVILDDSCPSSIVRLLPLFSQGENGN